MVPRETENIFGVKNKEHHGMLRYFLEWSINVLSFVNVQNFITAESILSYGPS